MRPEIFLSEIQKKKQKFSSLNKIMQRLQNDKMNLKNR